VAQEVYQKIRNQNKVINREWNREENDENQYEAFVEVPEGIEKIRRYIWGSVEKGQEESGKTYAGRLYG
jgi:ribosome maturation protein Sdo1